MCDYKQPLYDIVKQDSRNASWLGNAIGGKVGQVIEEEGNKNTQNPGRAVGKAAVTAALWYLGGAAGAAGSGGGAAADSAGSAAGAAGSAASALGTGAIAAGQGTQAALESTLLNQGIMPGTDAWLAAMQTGGSAAGAASAPGAAASTGGLMGKIYQAAVPGVNSQQADMLAAQTGDFGAAGLGRTMQAAAQAQGLTPTQQAVGNYGGGLLSRLGSAATQKNLQQLAVRQGSGLLQPRQPPPQPAPPPRNNQQPPPSANPYGQQVGMSPYTQTPGSSVGLSEIEKQRLRMLGYQV